MACLERISIQPMIYDKSEESSWAPTPARNISNVPHIFFDDGEPWTAANAHALSKLQAVSGNNIKTDVSNMGYLKAYASWFEDNGMDWRDFPRKKKDRCLFRYRGALIEQRDAALVSARP